MSKLSFIFDFSKGFITLPTSKEVQFIYSKLTHIPTGGFPCKQCYKVCCDNDDFHIHKVCKTKRSVYIIFSSDIMENYKVSCCELEFYSKKDFELFLDIHNNPDYYEDNLYTESAIIF